MRFARASFLPIIAATAALALSGCMQTAYPVAAGQPDLDSMAYGEMSSPSYSYSATTPRVADGAISALRNAMAASPAGY